MPERSKLAFSVRVDPPESARMNAASLLRGSVALLALSRDLTYQHLRADDSQAVEAALEATLSAMDVLVEPLESEAGHGN
ncbi:MAG TPA: hypothetical protein VGN26_12595 [Armatimonadota bacterium]|jgi:hypothetical protein